MKHYLTFILVSICLLGLTACSKKDDKPDKKGADVTAEIILESGKKVDFSYTMDNFDFFHGPDEEGNGYIVQLAGSHEAAQRSAMIYSLFAICKKHEVNPYQWLKYTLENIMSINHKNLKDLAISHSLLNSPLLQLISDYRLKIGIIKPT